jgi:hypothetical protein
VEEEEAELARAAAAVARLTAPDIEGCVVSSSTSAGNSSGSSSSAAMSTDGGPDRKQGAAVLGGVAVAEGDGPAAAKVRLLEEQLEEARAEVHSAPDDDSPAAVSMRH